LDLFCTKHKKKLAERFDTVHKQIESYCVDCKIESKYQVQIDKKEEERHEEIKSIGLGFWATIATGLIIIILLPIHMFFKVIFTIILIVSVLKKLISPYLSSLAESQNQVWDDIRARALNHSSIQANEVDNMKRQWKKAFLQEQKHQKWTEEDWQEYLKQFYKKEDEK
jgi:uncharacterized protein YdcH (DUF465 family)